MSVLSMRKLIRLKRILFYDIHITEVYFLQEIAKLNYLD